MSDTIADPPPADAPGTTPDPSDIEAIDPTPSDPFKVAGVDCEISRLKTVEMLALLRVLTRGAALDLADLDFEGDLAEQQGLVVGMILSAVPNAPEEFVAFIRRVVRVIPTGDKAADEQNAGLVMAALVNPEIEVTMEAIGIIASQEVEDFVALVGKARSMWASVKKVYARTRSTG